MKLILSKLTDRQLYNLIDKLRRSLPDSNIQVSKLFGELKRRRSISKPQVLMNDKKDIFGVINKEYYKTLSATQQESYINLKWREL